MKAGTFRTICLTIGFLGMVFIIVSKAGTVAKIVGISLSVILIIFGYVITGKWGKYIIGEPGTNEGGMGG